MQTKTIAKLIPRSTVVLIKKGFWQFPIYINMVIELHN